MIKNESGENLDFLLEQKIKKGSKKLHKNFCNCIFAVNYLLTNYKRIFPFFTNHTICHSEQVLTYCNIIAGGNIVNKLNVDEIYILLVGAILHDVGMGISKNNFMEMKKNIPELLRYMKTHKGLSIPEYTRLFHHEFSAQFIYKYQTLFEIPTKEHAYCVAQVARGHRQRNLLDKKEYPNDYLLPNGNKVNLAYLTALVKLADEMDITSERNVLFDYNHIDKRISAESIMCYKCHAALNLLEIYPNSLVFHYSTKEKDVGYRIIDITGKLEDAFKEYKNVVKKRTKFTNRFKKIILIKE